MNYFLGSYQLRDSIKMRGKTTQWEDIGCRKQEFNTRGEAKGKPSTISSEILGCHHAEGLETDQPRQKQEDLDYRVDVSEKNQKNKTNSPPDIFAHKKKDFYSPVVHETISNR